jgi:hypothetical protein
MLETGGEGRGRSTMFFGKQKFPKSFANNIFPEIFKIFSEQILHFLKSLQFYYVRAPSPQVGPPFFTFSPPPPGCTALSSLSDKFELIVILSFKKTTIRINRLQ